MYPDRVQPPERTVLSAAPLRPAGQRQTPAGRLIQARLLVNADSGRPEESAQQLADILAEMRRQRIAPEVFAVRRNSRVEKVAQAAVREGFKLVVVAGGDGTIERVAGALVGSSATLGLIPTGTRNNLAMSLGIPTRLVEAVAILRQGRRLKIDVGQVQMGRAGRWFLEAVTLGLLSDLYPLADGIQHGQLAQIGELLSTFIAANPSHLKITLDGRVQADTQAHMVLISNMPYLGPNFQVAPGVSFQDGRLDVFVYSDMGKLDLMAYVMQSTGGGAADERIQHHRVRQITIQATPSMAIVADGVPLGQGRVRILVHPHSLSVMAGPGPQAAPAAEQQAGSHG
jgi:YegS/Rv2252/BmrU family lipid kinase